MEKTITMLSADCLADSRHDHLPRVPHKVTVTYSDGSQETYRLSAACPMTAIEIIRSRIEG